MLKINRLGAEAPKEINKDDVPSALINIFIFFAVTYGIYKWRSNPRKEKT